MVEISLSGSGEGPGRQRPGLLYKTDRCGTRCRGTGRTGAERSRAIAPACSAAST